MEREFNRKNRIGLDSDTELLLWIGRIATDLASGMDTFEILKKYEKGKVEPYQIFAMIDLLKEMDPEE